MRKRLFGAFDFSKKMSALNKKTLAQEPVVNLDAYRSASRANYTKTILLVDDNPTALAALKRIFESSDYRVFVAKDAMEVSKILEDTSLDIILLDVQLPWIDGFELCSLLKSASFSKNLPVALISGNKTEEDVRRGFESGCDEFIVKPFDVHELQQTVAKLIG
ncbi:MAG: response regulator [Bdellovibrionota bacterium]